MKTPICDFDSPPFLRDIVKVMFEPLETFSEEDYDELTTYFRWLWEMKNKQEN